MSYEILLHTPEKTIKVKEFSDISEFKGNFQTDIDGFSVKVDFEEKGIATLASIKVISQEDKKCYISLHGTKENADLFSFMRKCEKECVLRQSPHNFTRYLFKMDINTMPLIAEDSGEQVKIFISDAPAFSDNYTTQHIIPEKGEFYLSSGDPGISPNFEGDDFSAYYHDVTAEKAHEWKFIVTTCDKNDMKSIRKAAFLAVECAFGDGDTSSVYRAMSFSGNYMHYRRNESGSSDYWIVPGIQYANCQYTRDSFYQTAILNAEMEEQCYKALRRGHDTESFHKMEYPLVYVIWSYRIKSRGGNPDKEILDECVKVVFENSKDGAYYPLCLETGAYHNWFDICCFERDDIDTYVQGMYITALRAAKELGYDIGDSYEKAKEKYYSLFNGEFYPLSKKKQYLALDVFVGEMLHYMLFDELFVPDDEVLKHYRKIMTSNAKTKFGTKIVADVNGDFLPMEAFGANGYIEPGMKGLDTGRYANGGSYHIYEMLFHIAAYLHGVPEALENMKWRLKVDIDYDGTTHEYMHTVRGFGGKENQGWNAFIYKIWSDIMARGKADGEFFDFAEKLLSY